MRDRPRVSLVTAVYNVEPYLEPFIASIEAQGMAPGVLEVIAVDDGSTDGSRAVLEAWRDRSQLAVTVLSQPNAGQGAARNRGLAAAAGEWVSFPDPDDVLEPGYIAAFLEFADAHPGVDMMGAAIRILRDADGTVTDDHPRAWQFERGTRVVDLDDEPEIFPQTAPRALFRLDTLRAHRHAFDEQLRPNFEDAHFSAVYLLALERPVAGLVAEARYQYRLRVAGSSTMQHAHADPRRYTTVLERGYLDLFARAEARFGAVPAWLQHLVIYDATFYLRENDRLISRVRFPPELAAPFHDRFARVANHLDPAVIAAHRGASFTTLYRDLLTHAYRDARWHSDVGELIASDRVRRLQQVAYRYVGSPPTETFLVDGVERAPAFAKRRDLVYYDRRLMGERLAWLPSGTIELRLDGDAVPVRKSSRRLRPPRATAPAGASAKKASARPSGLVARVRRRIAVELVRFAGRGFDGAWILCDRLGAAGGNAEALFRALRTDPDVNAWFVLEQTSADWPRLRAVAGDRLVPYGSRRWKLLIAHARWALISHRERDLLETPELLGYLHGRHVQVGLLGDGVIADDGSRLLRPGNVDLFITATPWETEAILADGTPSGLTVREVERTGLPRIARLTELVASAPPPDLLLVAPDSRDWLTVPVDLEHGRVDRRARPGLAATEYARRWRSFLASPELVSAAADAGLRLAFLPHPDVAMELGAEWIPDGVELLPAVGADVQAQLARAALLVTDYRSLAFDIAAAGRPVVHYQFDANERGIGALRGRPVSFDYERDALGPVATDEAAVLALVRGALVTGPRLISPYAERARAAFPARDSDPVTLILGAVRRRSRPWAPAPGADEADATDAAQPAAGVSG
jgi:glycosyltransferase involved in cell wall biosynthesis